MGSTLTVDNIVGATTAANVKLPAGSIVQVAQDKVAGNVSASGSGYNDTGLSINFTPKFASSILELSLMGGRHYIQAVGQQLDVRIHDASNNPVGNITNQRLSSHYTNSGTSLHLGNYAGYLQIPATNTSARTYKVAFDPGGGTTTFFNNGSLFEVYFIIREIAQ